MNTYLKKNQMVFTHVACLKKGLANQSLISFRTSLRIILSIESFGATANFF